MMPSRCRLRLMTTPHIRLPLRWRLRHRILAVIAAALLIADGAYLSWLASRPRPFFVDLPQASHGIDFVNAPDQKAVFLTPEGWRSTDGMSVSNLVEFGSGEAVRHADSYPGYPLYVGLGQNPVFGQFIKTLQKLRDQRVCRIVMADAGDPQLLPSSERVEVLQGLEICVTT